VPGRALVSDGNFQPVVLAIARDALRIARAQPGPGQLSERQMCHRWDAFVRQQASGLPPMVTDGLPFAY
jgi:histidine ammonia-lyase